MRPMYAVGSNNIEGSFSPKPPSGMPLDVKLSITPRSTVAVTAYGSGYGRIPGYGTYIEIGNTRYDVHRFWNTLPQPVIQLRPQLPQLSQQVQNPTPLMKEPGYTNSVPMGQTPMSQIVNKPYLGSPVM